MASQDKVIQLSVKVNADTGQLEVLGAKFKGAASGAKQAQSSFQGLAGEAGNLFKSYLPFATAGGIIAFFTNAVMKANEHAESMRRLKGNVEAAGLSFDENKQKIEEWSQAIQAATRFDDDQAIDSLQRFVRATGDLTTAMRASKLAMDLSVQTGKTLEQSQQLIIDLVANNERGLRAANKELGAFTGGARTAQSALDNLQRTLGGAAEKEQSFQKEINQTAAVFDDFSKTIGRAFMPAVEMVLKGLAGITKLAESMGSMIAGVFAAMLHGVAGVGAALLALTTGHFSRAKVLALDTAKQITADFQATEEDLAKIWEKASDKQIQEALKGSNGRIQAAVQGQQEINDKVSQMMAELDLKVAQIGDDSFSKKRDMAAREIELERAKIDKEFKDEVDKNGKILKVNQDRVKLLGKLGELEAKQNAELAKQEVRVRAAAALEIGDLAVQTLSVLNSMGDSQNRSAVMRAKVILALEKSIAIAKAIAAAQSGGPFAAGIAAASIALITAQFGAQFKAIDEAASQSTQDSGMSAGGGSGGIDAAASLGSSAEAINSPARGGSPVIGSANSGGSGGGGGGTFNITVSIQLNAASIDLSNADQLFRIMVDGAKAGTLDALSKMLGSRLVEQINGAGQISMVRGGG